MKITGHYDGKVVVLDEPVSLPTGTRVEVSVQESAPPLDRDPASGLYFSPGDPTALDRALSEIWADNDNPWRDVGADFAEKLRERTNRSRYTW